MTGALLVVGVLAVCLGGVLVGFGLGCASVGAGRHDDFRGWSADDLARLGVDDHDARRRFREWDDALDRADFLADDLDDFARGLHADRHVDDLPDRGIPRGASHGADWIGR